MILECGFKMYIIKQVHTHNLDVPLMLLLLNIHITQPHLYYAFYICQTSTKSI